MKKYFMIVLGVLFCAPYGMAETIDTVTFNPARLGRYDVLKVSDTLTSKGGIESQAVVVQSKGTVDINNNANYQIDSTNVEGKIYMPQTRFVAHTLYSSGPAMFISPSGESDISSLTSGEELRVRANILRLGNVSVTGETALDYNNDEASGLTLGGNLIPPPGSTCQNLDWFSYAAEEDGATTNYRVLGFESCQEDCEKSCGSWTDISIVPIDTCDGDKENAFDCSTVSKKTECRDIRKVTSSATETSHVTSPAVEIAEGDYYTDTCDGDLTNQYRCDGTVTKDCRDVYAYSIDYKNHLCAIRGSCVPGGDMAPWGCSYLSDESLPRCRVKSDFSGKSKSQIIAENGIKYFCDYYVAPYTDANECYGVLNDGESSEIGGGAISRPVETFNLVGGSSSSCNHYWDVLNGYYYGFKCHITRYKRELACRKEGEETYQLRNLTCCPGEKCLPLWNKVDFVIGDVTFVDGNVVASDLINKIQ